MDTPGRAISAVMANRHAFEALGRGLDLDQYKAAVPSMAAYRNTFGGDLTSSWLVLAGFTALFLLATVVVLRWRSLPHGRGTR